MVTLVWISIFHGACQLMNFTWTQFGLNIRFLQPQANEVRSKIGPAYNHVCLAKYPQEAANILHHDIFYCFSWKMKNLCLKPSMIVVFILTSSLQAKSGSMQRKWRHQASCKWSQSSSNQSDETSVDRPPTKQTHEKGFRVKATQSQVPYLYEQQVPPYKESLILN